MKEDKCDEFKVAYAQLQWGVCALEPAMQTYLYVFCNYYNEVVLRDFLINSFGSLMNQTNDICVIDYLKFIVGIVRFRVSTMKINHVKLIIDQYLLLTNHILDNCKSEATTYNELLFRIFLEIYSKHSDAWLD